MSLQYTLHTLEKYSVFMFKKRSLGFAFSAGFAICAHAVVLINSGGQVVFNAGVFFAARRHYFSFFAGVGAFA